MLSVVGIPIALNLDEFLFGPEGNGYENINLVKFFLIACIGAPLVETLVFQKLIYALLIKIKYFKSHPIWIIVIGALLFGFAHCHDRMICSVMLGGGAILMYVYVIRKGKNPYWTVALTHFLYNLFIFMLNVFDPY